MILGRTLPLSKLLCLAVALALTPTAIATKRRLPTTSNRDYYRISHSYPTEHSFSERDGWDTVPISDLPYKYSIRATHDTPALNTTQVQHIPIRHHRKRKLSKRCSAQPDADPVVQVAQYNPPAPASTPSPTPTPAPAPAPVVQAAEYTPEPSPSPSPKPKANKDVFGELTDSVGSVSAEVDALKGQGDPEDVTITW